MTYSRFAAASFLVSALASTASAQRVAPLLKTDLIELLSSPIIAHGEVAELVRRNCLAFRPTERDWSDIRSLGAAPDVVASINGCSGKPMPAAPPPATPTPAPAPTLQVVLRQPRVVATAGSQVRIAVLAARGGIPQGGAQLVLRGSAGIDGGSGRDAVGASDDSGFVVFPLRVGRRLASYRLEVAPAGGGTFPGRPIIDLVVRPGAPASASVEPREILFDLGLDSITLVSVTLRDSVGHPVAGEAVVLRAGAPDMGYPPETAVSDSNGRAQIVVARGAIRRPGTLQVEVRDKSMGSVGIVIGMPLSDAGTGFLPPVTTSGEAGSGLSEPMVFEARTKLGRPAFGRAVSFRAVNATVTPTSGTTDSTGRVRLEVTLGERVGRATIVASIDSLEKRVALQVGPGPAVELVLEHNGFRVNGRWVGVGLDSTFVVRLRMLDAYGNATDVAGLARMLRETPFDARIPIVRVVGIQEEASAVALTLRAIRPGRANIKLRAADITAPFMVEVVDVR